MTSRFWTDETDAARRYPILLLRHGETEWSRDGRHTSTTDVALTDHGRQQAEELRPLLRQLLPAAVALHVVSSPRQRALETATGSGLQVAEVDDNLAEWDYGDYEGRSTPSIRQQVPDWTVWTHPVPGGESPEHVEQRADAALTRALARTGSVPVVLVGHGHFTRVLIARWLGLRAVEGVYFALQAAGVSMLGYERGVPQLEALNVPATPQSSPL